MNTREWRATTTGILVFFFVLLAGREIDRPFIGLHSWDESLASWVARAHLKYGLGYTRGIATLAVGNPPPAVPPRYLDHPQLHALLDTGAMALFGQNDFALRLAALIVTAACLPFLVALLRRLYDDDTAVLATFLYIIFPITPYFNAAAWTYWMLPFILLGFWCYLVLIGELRDAGPAGKRHLVGVAVAVFILPQLYWVGFFYPAAIAIHYLLRSFKKRQWPDKRILAAIVVPTVASTIVVFGILLYARPGGMASIMAMYRSRSDVAANDPTRTRIGWFVRQWEMVRSNFTLPVCVIVAGYIVYRVISHIRSRSQSTGETDKSSRTFLHASLFSSPGLLSMVFLTEWFWPHEFAYKSFSLPVAIATALGILKIRDSLEARRNAWGNWTTFAVIAVICAFAIRGLDDYYGIRHRTPTEAEMFKQLNRDMAPDQTLLTYQSYYMPQFAGKLVHLRPEVAWYLDRNMEVSTSLEDVEQKSANPHYPFYLVDVGSAPEQLIEQLKARYPYRFIQGSPFREKPHLVAGIGDQLIFDLRSSEVSLMTAGLNALYQERDGAKAAEYFRKILAQNPDHYGANFQIAAALDLQGAREQANPYWEKTLSLAKKYADTATAGVAATRLRGGR